MKRDLTSFLVVFFALFLSFQLEAQSYKTAVGARLGSPLSASIKHFLNESNAVEAFIGYRNYSFYNWTSVGAAYQIHKPIENVDGLQYYLGFGASVFIWSYDNTIWFDDNYSSTSFGIQGYAGLDYTFENTPISLTVDWVPTYFIGTNFISGFGAGYGSLGVRYILSR